MNTNDTRKAFLDFFAKEGHEVLPSSPLVPHNDPTLMFTNAGMVQFKNVFTGAEKFKFPRAATSQKCVRAGGKHNDLDNVGYTARHHTFFEMLGNFSFGDYFKEKAISHAWELLTKVYALPKEKLMVTVYHTDDEAFNLWKKIAGLPDAKIIRIPTNDNFWSMGDTGPCGPCSEIFYDHGDKIPGGPPGSADQDGDRFIEIWNLVFMQYEQLADDTRIDLPRPSIDTGMGLERLAAVLQGKHDNYDIDLFKGLILASGELSKTKTDGEHIASHRVIADHLRSTAFLMADGVMPSNEGRGYVLRRIMRRAMRHAHIIGCREPLMHKLVPALIAEMGAAYPELKRAEALITENLRLEEERFKQTLERGLKLLDEETAKLASGAKLPGDAAFKLYDTYGFPLDLTQDILRGQQREVDTAGFETAMNEQKERARAAWSGSGDKGVKRQWFELKDKIGATEFLGYVSDTGAASIRAIVVDGNEVATASSGEAFIITNQTLFYGESGGQMGDHGTISKDGKKVAQVIDTLKPVDDFIVHKVQLIAPVSVGDEVDLAIDATRRDLLRANHSATHILHEVLRRLLGEHITQKGSLVAPDRLRFDISHPKPITREEVAVIEQEVNRIIWHNSEVGTRLMTPDEAIKNGAMALFGEKYGDEVRVVNMGPELGSQGHSVELCGGTHVRRTGDIGLFKIVSEGAVAAGIRRIEAVTSTGAFAYLSEQDSRIRDLAAELKATPENVNERIFALIAERKKLEKELADAKRELALGGGNAETEKETIGNIIFMAKAFPDLAPKELRPVAESFLKEIDNGVVAVASGFEGKASLVIAVTKPLADSLNAADLVKEACVVVGGKGGGGRPEMAQAGGPDGDKIDAAINSIRDMVRKKLAS